MQMSPGLTCARDGARPSASNGGRRRARGAAWPAGAPLRSARLHGPLASAARSRNWRRQDRAGAALPADLRHARMELALPGLQFATRRLAGWPDRWQVAALGRISAAGRAQRRAPGGREKVARPLFEANKFVYLSQAGTRERGGGAFSNWFRVAWRSEFLRLRPTQASERRRRRRRQAASG